MGKKYIIELPENTHWIQWLMEGTEDHHPYIDFKSVEDLTPYTEPDLEQVKADVWKCAGKIAYMYSEERKKVFGENLIQNIYDIYSASEAIEKIRQYEQEQDAEIKVGDEVCPREAEYDDMIVTRLWKDDYDSDWIDAIGFDGRISSFLVSRVSKTGEHYEIAEVLRKMRESE